MAKTVQVQSEWNILYSFTILIKELAVIVKRQPKRITNKI